MIKKCVIANRGEIAARIIRTCHKQGITAVAVYSEADRGAPFVSLADESYFIGPSRVQESYLNADKIMSVAEKSHADAIHPGYGFLSENGAFADKCEAAGIRFIGPSGNVIETMGDKIAAREAMEQAGVPVVPGTDGAVQSAEEAIQAASDIGYPVMLKASAGGGGIGMQAVDSADALTKAFESNSKRARTFFGNGAMFMEKKLANARHIEIQLLADNYGNAVHLFERECSIQRRNQKVIEEAPSPVLSEQTRQKMGDAAVKAAKTLGYASAGTIEFMVDEQENFYFLEMNTRIQVEHPVTEEITGLDIVKLQILIAEGEQLPFTQDSITRNGHAIEARIYAEDPDTFLPSPGYISEFKPPEGSKIRNELTVTKDFDVTPFYDPLIGKLIAKGSDRQEAIKLLQEALRDYRVDGIKTNIPLLMEILGHEQFAKGNTTTAFVENYYLTNEKSNQR
ncbi:acetyl-CoA carboxylase biotin carboxylase subunit [Barrientosiimonas marina]|uniref:biotin carboxylase n=1 Tax=Lentibacillus kimchii TaxID=1542911 RepID=A0ABW2UWL1_9BACI